MKELEGSRTDRIRRAREQRLREEIRRKWMEGDPSRGDTENCRGVTVMRGDRTSGINTGTGRGLASGTLSGRHMGSGMQGGRENHGGGRRDREHVEDKLKNPELRGKKQEYRGGREEEISFEGARGNGEGAERERTMDGDRRIRSTGRESNEEGTRRRQDEKLSGGRCVWDRRWVLDEPNVNYQRIEDSDRVGAWEGDLWRHENGNHATVEIENFGEEEEG